MEANGLTIDTHEAGNERHLKLVGELDLSNFSHLIKAIEDWESVDRVVVDTTQVSFVDSSGFGALVAAQRTLGADRFRLVPGPATLRVLEISATREMFGLDGRSGD